MSDKEINDINEIKDKIYLEILVEGVIVSDTENIKEVKQSITKIITDILSNYDSSKITVQVSSFDESDLILSVLQNTPEPMDEH